GSRAARGGGPATGSRAASGGGPATSDVANVKGRDRDGQTKEKTGSTAKAKAPAKKVRGKKGGSEGQGSLF
ncbi:MAG TPA: hypothetical protein VKP30_22870, partial [Polyangiaceae bacterium]|nr:hypothetical protein [Polyangiaceae bacterium]